MFTYLQSEAARVVSFFFFLTDLLDDNLAMLINQRLNIFVAYTLQKKYKWMLI